MISTYNTKHLLPQSEVLFVQLLYKVLDMLPNKNEYWYIAFSSLTFFDYKLFSRIIDSKSMIVVRDSQSSIDRIRYNFPYEQNSIFDDSFEDVVRDLPIKKYVIKLNYQSELSHKILNDIEYMIDKVEIGSIFMLSINVDAPKLHLCKEDQVDPVKRKERKNEALEELNEVVFDSINIEKELDPFLEEECILYHWNYSKKCKELIDNKIHRTLNSRDAKERKGIKYLQLFNYNTKSANGIKYLTIGGIIYDEAMEEGIEQLNLTSNILLNVSNVTKNINMPILTEKEVELVNEIVPNEIPSEKKEILVGCSSSNLHEVSKVYSYLD